MTTISLNHAPQYLSPVGGAGGGQHITMTNEQQQARELYFQSGLTQAQIAEQVNVSGKTISTWVNEGKWNRLRAALEVTPAMMIEKLYLELAEINQAIDSRAPGQRFALPVEAETRRKILTSIRYIKEQQSAGANLEILVNFIEFLKDFDRDILIPVTRAADYYLRNEKELGKKNLAHPYDVQINTIPPIDDFPIQKQPPQPVVKNPVIKNNNTLDDIDYTGMPRDLRNAMKEWNEFAKNLLDKK